MSLHFQSSRVVGGLLISCAMMAPHPAEADEPRDRLIVNEGACHALATYDPAAAPTVEPGVTADGRAVPPADLDAAAVVPPVVFIGIEAPVEKRGTFSTDTRILTLALDLATGALTTLDGRRIESLRQGDVVAACNSRARIHEEAFPTP